MNLRWFMRWLLMLKFRGLTALLFFIMPFINKKCLGSNNTCLLLFIASNNLARLNRFSLLRDYSAMHYLDSIILPAVLGQLVSRVKLPDLYTNWSQSSDSFSDDKSWGGSTQRCNKHPEPEATSQMGVDWLTEKLASGKAELTWQAGDLMGTEQTFIGISLDVTSFTSKKTGAVS